MEPFTESHKKKITHLLKIIESSFQCFFSNSLPTDIAIIFPIHTSTLISYSKTVFAFTEDKRGPSCQSHLLPYMKIFLDNHDHDG